MKVNANSVRIGNAIEHQKRLWRVLKREHTMPGKGGAFVQLEMKELKTGTKLNERFRSSENIEVIRLDEKEYQYLYADGANITLMDGETYEQMSISKDLLGEQAALLQDGMIVKVESYEGEIIGVSLPEEAAFEVIEAEPVVKGQTASSSNKPATLENGVRVMVPQFISTGDRVVIKIVDLSYVERAK